MQFCSNLGLIKIQTIGKFQNNVLNLIFRYLNWARYFLYIDIYINVTIKAYDVLSIYLPNVPDIHFTLRHSYELCKTLYVYIFAFSRIFHAYCCTFPSPSPCLWCGILSPYIFFWWIGFLLMLASQSVCSHVCRNAWKFCKVDCVLTDLHIMCMSLVFGIRPSFALLLLRSSSFTWNDGLSCSTHMYFFSWHITPYAFCINCFLTGKDLPCCSWMWHNCLCAPTSILR